MPGACFVNMYKYIIFCLCLSLNGALCDLMKPEGDSCEWNGVKGQCVRETQCLTTLDTHGEPHLVCSVNGDVTIVCCTDCELVNDTRNVVMSPRTGYYWKDGTKAWDTCLQYLQDLPYKCRDGGFYSGISKNYDEEKKCHTIGMWGIGGAPSPGHKPGNEYPFQAFLGYGEELGSTKWIAGGSIISDKFILTAAHVNSLAAQNGELKFVGLFVEKEPDSPSSWEIRRVKRFIPHPNYQSPSKYNDIALIELKTPIVFNKNVLPACLHVEEADANTAIALTWTNPKSHSLTELADTIQAINLDEFTEEECKTAYSDRSHETLKNGIDYNTQMCYGSKSHSSEACQVRSGTPLMSTTQFSRCIYTIIGVTSSGSGHCGADNSTPEVYTRVAYYKSWIESVVWP